MKVDIFPKKGRQGLSFPLRSFSASKKRHPSSLTQQQITLGYGNVIFHDKKTVTVSLAQESTIDFEMHTGTVTCPYVNLISSFTKLD